MNTTDEKMKKAREVAMRNAKVILAEAGIDENDRAYPSMVYEMQYTIYHELKKCMGIPDDKH